MVSRSGTSALRTLEASFAALSDGPAGLSYQDRPLPQLRDELHQPHTPLARRDAVWTSLVALARTGDPRWVVAAVGMALLGLRHHSRQLAAWPTQPQDVDAELVRGFLEALAQLDVGRPAIAARMIAAARRRAARLCRVGSQTPDADPAGRWADNRTAGPPDFLLADAVAAGVISRVDSRMLAATRLEGRPDTTVAAALGIPVGTLRSRRARAVRTLVAALASGAL